MAISMVCTCGRVLKAKDAMAGTRARCPGCGAVLPVPSENEENTDSLLSSGDSPRLDEAKPIPLPPHAQQILTNAEVQEGYPGSPANAASTRSYLHWLLPLALIPLAASLLHSGREDLKERLDRTLAHAPADVRARVNLLLESEEATLSDVLAALPNGRVEGAHLPRGSKMHWLYAALATCLYLGFLMLISIQADADSMHLLGIGLFTATVGILLLLLLQFVAASAQGMIPRGRGVAVILFWIVKFIGFSYYAALDARNGFFLSFLGFTCGVGFCEELCKALPLLVHFRRKATLGWHGAFLWGLASGAGFGIAEGIIYAGDQYNGIAPLNAYLVRFISCVALHAVWSGSVALTLYRRQELIQGEMRWYAFIPAVVRIAGVATLLHGLYDTLLKKEMGAPALAVAIASFLWLAWQMHGLAAEHAVTPAANV